MRKARWRGTVVEMFSRCPLLIAERTEVGHRAMSEKCQQQTSRSPFKSGAWVYFIDELLTGLAETLVSPAAALVPSASIAPF